ncbi:MAG TPA: hypothetical protein VF543_01660 [Pyrinomonadaceae bacterium]|jgi:hypothetical protein
MSISKYLNLRQMRAPIVVYFEHLTSEYSTVKAQVGDAEDLTTLDHLKDRMEKDELSWNDLYTFELILAKYRPREQLRSKVIQLRNDYRSVAGQQEYDEYIASKPQNLLEPPDPKNPPDASEEELSLLLREDIKDLLSRLFLLYEILPVREAELKRLTWRAAKICLIAMGVLFIFVIVMFWLDSSHDTKEIIPSLAIFVVVIAGAMGGFVSALQRIQRQPSGGDSFYNLAQLYYASYSVFIAPIPGAIFAILLYLMFAARVLQGSFFPEIYTPPAGHNNGTEKKQTNNRRGNSVNNANNTNVSPASNTAPPATTANPNNATPNASPPSTAPDAGANANAKQAQEGSAGNTKENMGTGSADESMDKSSAEPTPTPTPPSETPPAYSIGIRAFLAESGPAEGKDYALLMLWCFIAGFAERFVPDALDRLVSQKGASGNKA